MKEFYWSLQKMKQSIGSGRGSVYNIIMKALQSGDKYGYEICQEVETQTNGKYILKQPSLYSGLKRLEAQKLVESYWGDSDIGGRRHYYKLTDAGRKKIESTNFSWEDERENIVDNFFKKSELDQNIDNIQQSIEQTKNDVNNAIETNEQISSVLSGEKVENTNNRTNNQFGHKVNENQYDLFSYSNSIANEQASQSLFEFLPSDKTNEQTLTSEEAKTGEESSNSTQTESSLVEKAENSPLEQTSTPIEQNQEEREKIEQKQEPTFDYNSFFQNKKINSFSETKEEFTSSPQTYEDLQKSSTFYGSNISQEETSTNDDFDRKYAEFQAMFGNMNESDEAKKDENINSFSPFTEKGNAQQENKSNEQNDIANENQPTDEQIRLEQERRMSDILSGNFEQKHDELKMTFDSSLNSENQTENSPANENNSQENRSESQTNNEVENLNLKSIFGDLYDDREQQQKIEKERQKFLDTYFAEKPAENEFQEFEQNLRVSNETVQDELPRYDMSNNINYSLKPDENYVPKKQIVTSTQPEPEVNQTPTFTNFSPNYTTPQYSQNSVSFDKKYENRGYNFNDYEIRYLRQNNINDKQTKFVKINKLKFFSSITTSLIALILSLVCFFVLNQSRNHIQTLFYILDFTLIGLFATYNIFTFASDPNRRGIFKYSKKKIWLDIMLSILIIGVIVCFNIFILNMNLTNILSFGASLFIPIIGVILCQLTPILSILFHKFQFTTK